MRIACVHQGFELYGSDRSFSESVSALRAAYPDADIEVVLPRPGPIVTLLERDATRIVFEPLWILRRHSLARLATVELARLPMALARAWRRLRAADLIYINTSVVVDYSLAARFFPQKTLLHIHEIPEGAALKILTGLIRWSGAELIFNSRATQTAFAGLSGMRTHVIYNGVAGPTHTEPTTYDAQRPLRILLLGRINRIKGQEVLLEALAALPPQFAERVTVRMVGSPFESDEPERKLKAMVAELGLSDRVSILPFVEDPSPHYRWTDIVVVPSRRPESLGRVAIEAMAYGRPPVVSAIGGLIEVVEDKKTGWLVPPGDAAALADKLKEIILMPETWRPFVSAGRERYERLFSDTAVAKAIAHAVAAKLGTAAPSEPRAAAENDTVSLP